jgi:hypothetical protein
VDGAGPTATRDTVPLGRVVPGFCGVTVAVKATCWLTADGLGVDTTLVVVVAWLTVAVTCGLAGLIS